MNYKEPNWSRLERERFNRDMQRYESQLRDDILNDKDIAMKPHERRVVQEKQELDERATKLSEFIGTGSIFPTLPVDEQERLREQCEIMWQYSEILGKRIAAFPVRSVKEK